jgi:N-carbamoyl-D-amino-acid hydrolase
MTRYVKVAAAQLGPIHLADSRSSVVSRMIALLREAAGSGCRLVVFPELALTTFFPRYWIEDEAELDGYFETAMPGPETAPLFDEAKRLGVGFYLGYAELDHSNAVKKRYNTSILVDPAGDIIGKYRKIHLPGHRDRLANAPFQHLEKRYFEVGDFGFPVWELLKTRIGMCLCNDRRWPETFRVMALQSAEMVVLGYNTPTTNIHHQEPLHLRMLHHMLSLQAAAYQNGMWIVATGKAGAEDNHRLHGGSCIVAPTGEVVAQSLTESDELITYKCDMELGAYIRRTVFNFKAHRRIEHYGLITQRTGAEPPR